MGSDFPPCTRSRDRPTGRDSLSMDASSIALSCSACAYVKTAKSAAISTCITHSPAAPGLVSMFVLHPDYQLSCSACAYVKTAKSAAISTCITASPAAPGLGFDVCSASRLPGSAYRARGGRRAGGRAAPLWIPGYLAARVFKELAAFRFWTESGFTTLSKYNGKGSILLKPIRAWCWQESY